MLFELLFAVLTGFSAFAYSHSIGENLHLDQRIGQWQNYSFLEQLLEGMHIHSVRSSLQIAADDGYAPFLNELVRNGITSDEVVNTSFTSTVQVATALQPLKGVLWLEGPNEQDICCDDAGWVAHDQAVVSLLAPFSSGGFSIIAPSVAFAAPAELGNLQREVQDGNAHLYTGKRMPETAGWGPLVYGQPYGSIEYNLAKARLVGAALPVVSTEEGYSSAELSEQTQAAYIERATLWAFLHGVAHQWLYDLVDDVQAFGVARNDGSLKPAAQGLAGLLQLTDERAASSAPCTLGASISTSLPYDSLVLCKANGEKDLVVWEPAQLEDPVTGAPTPASEVTITVDAPKTTGRTMVYAQSPEYRWAGAPAFTNRRVTTVLSERPLVIVFHAKRIETFPTLPFLGTGTGITPGNTVITPGT